jgi:hypothetical protein
MSESNPNTTVQILKRDLKLLKQISTFTGISESEIVKNFIVELWLKTSDHFLKAIKSGDLIGYQVEIKAGIKIPMVSGQYAIPLDTAKEITDAKNLELAEQQFKQLDSEKAERKKAWDKQFPLKPLITVKKDFEIPVHSLKIAKR